MSKLTYQGLHFCSWIGISCKSALLIYSDYKIYQNCLSFEGWMIFHCIYNLFMHLSIDGHMNDFHFVAIVNNAAITMSVHISHPHLHLFCMYAHKWTCWIWTLIFWGLWKSSKLWKKRSNVSICDILIQNSFGYLMPPWDSIWILQWNFQCVKISLGCW